MKIIYSNGSHYMTVIVDGGYKNVDFVGTIFFIRNLVYCIDLNKTSSKNDKHTLCQKIDCTKILLIYIL